MEYMHVLSTDNPEWRKEAEQLAEAGTPFDLVGFNYSFDIQDYKELKRKYGLKARFHPCRALVDFGKGFLVAWIFVLCGDSHSRVAYCYPVWSEPVQAGRPLAIMIWNSLVAAILL